MCWGLLYRRFYCCVCGWCWLNFGLLCLICCFELSGVVIWVLWVLLILLSSFLFILFLNCFGKKLVGFVGDVDSWW